MFKSQLNPFKCIFTLWVQRYGIYLITPNILVAIFATTIKYLVYQKK